MKAELYWIHGIEGRLAIMPRPRAGEWLADEMSSLKKQGVDVLVSMLTDEENDDLDLVGESDAARAAGMTFVSFPMEDRSIPADDAVILALADRLLALVQSGQGVAVHCRGGVGRSAMLVACVLMKMGRTPKDALDLIAETRGCRVPDTDEQKEWIERVG